MLRLFSYRDARLLVVGQTLSAFGDFAMFIVMAVWMKTLTGSSWRAGLVFFVLAVGNLAGPLGGLLADRLRRRPLMIATDCLLGAAVLVLFAVHSRSDAWLIYLVALLYGVAGSVFYPARSALLRLMVPEDLLAEANGILSSTQQGVRIAAPLAGAGLYAAFGGGVVAILDAATFAGSAVFLSAMHTHEEKPRPEEQHFMAEVTAGFRHVWRTLPLRQLVAGVSVALLVVGFSETLIFFVIHRVGRHPSFFGVMATMQGIGAIAGGLTAAWIVRRLGDVRAAGIGLGLFGVCSLLLTLPWLPVVLVAFPVAGVGIAWVLVGYGTALQTRTPLVIQGRVSAAADLVATLAQTTSIATGAVLSIVVDYRILFVVMAAVLAGSALYLATRRETPLATERLPATMGA